MDMKKTLIVYLLTLLPLNVSAYPYVKGLFTADELIKVLKIEIELEKNISLCGKKSLTEGLNENECISDAHAKRDVAVSSFPSIDKKLKEIPEFSKESESYYCTPPSTARRVRDCNLDILVGDFCKKNWLQIEMTRGSRSESCGIEDVNALIRKVRADIVRGKPRGPMVNPLDIKYTGQKESIINPLREKLKLEKNKTHSLDYIYWADESWVKSKYPDDGIRKSFYYYAPDGFQVCELLSYKKKERKNAKVRVKPVVFPEDKNLRKRDQRIKGYEFDLNAISGNWHDQYSSTASVRNILFSTVSISTSTKDRKDYGCTIFKDPVPVPVEDPPHMNVQVSISRSDTSEHSGRVKAVAEGVPPWEVSYTVQALRDGEWHEVAKDKVKFTKNKVEFTKDYYWHNAESWRLKDVIK